MRSLTRQGLGERQLSLATRRGRRETDPSTHLAYAGIGLGVEGSSLRALLNGSCKLLSANLVPSRNHVKRRTMVPSRYVLYQASPSSRYPGFRFFECLSPLEITTYVGSRTFR